jgi:transposase InsO family protein
MSVLAAVDEYSRYAEVHVLGSKAHTAAKLKDIILQRKNANKRVQILRSDRGGEFINHDLGDFLKREGIEHCTSPPREPHSNGRLIERLFGTIVPRLRNVLHHRGIKPRFWPQLLGDGRVRSAATALPTAPRYCIEHRNAVHTAEQMG